MRRLWPELRDVSVIFREYDFISISKEKCFADQRFSSDELFLVGCTTR